MLAQAEHGQGSLIAAASPSQRVCEALARELESLVVERPTVCDTACAIGGVPGARDAVRRWRTRSPPSTCS